MVQTCDNLMDLGLHYTGGVWEKFKFQVPNCFNINSHEMRTHIILEQKNPSGQQTSTLV